METSDLLDYPSIARWESRIILTKSYLWSLKAFIEWARVNDTRFAEATPDSLIEYQKGLDNGRQYEVLDAIQGFINSLEARHNSKSTIYNQIRSFFSHNRAPLPQDSGFNIRGDIPPVKGLLQPEHIRAVIMASNKLYRALFLCMFQGCMDLDMITYWSSNGLPDLKEAFNKKLDVVRLDLPGRKTQKNKRSFYTFIGPDAVKALRDYLPKNIHDEREDIFLVKYGGSLNPISKEAIYRYWMRKLMRLSLIPREKLEDKDVNRYGMNPHEMRDVWRTLWSKSPADHRIGEYFMGHVVDSLGYDKSFEDEDYTRKEYLKAVPFLNLLSNDRAFGKVDEDEIEKLRMENEALKVELDKRNALVNGLAEKFSRIEKALKEKGILDN